MRTLVEQADPAGLVLLDGVKTIDADGWTLVLPDPETPVTRIHAEAKNAGRGRANGSSGRPTTSSGSSTEGTPD